MSAEEVDFSHFNGLSLDSDIDRDSRNESVKVVLGLISNSNDPVLVVAWRVKGPLEESGGVIEAELTIIVFNVMTYQKLVELLQLCLVTEVDIAPVVLLGQFQALSIDIADFLNLNRSVEIVCFNKVVNVLNGLGRPELMLIEETEYLSQLFSSFGLTRIVFSLGHELS